MFINENNLKELPQADVIPPSLELDSATSVRGSNFIMEKEIWKAIPNSELHEVSTLSRFRTSFFKGEYRIMKLHISKTGYYSLRINGKTTRAHRIIAQVFIPNPYNLPQVNHIDGNKLNNSIPNLEWVTNKQNSEHAWENGLIKRQFGENASKAVLKTEDVMDIVSSPKSDNELAVIYNVHTTTINNIRCGKTWSDITKLERRHMRYVDPVQVMNIFNSPHSDSVTANIFGVCRQYVNSIKTGKRYSEITGKAYIKKQKAATKITPEIIHGVKAIRHLRLKDAMNAFNVSECVVVKIRSGKFDHLIKEQ